MKIITALLAATALTVGVADAATFKPIASGKSLVMTGEVVAGDAGRFTEAYSASYRKYGYVPERIFLNSPGGQVVAGVELAEVIRLAGMHTVVGKTDTCASICVTVFAAGSHREIFPTSLLAVHSVSVADDGNPENNLLESGVAAEVTINLAIYMAALGAPYSVIAKMVTTPGTDVTWLGLDDFYGWAEVVQS